VMVLIDKMISALKRRLLSPAWWFSQLKTVLIMVVIVSAVAFYQQRNMVSGVAPALVLNTLEGKTYNLQDELAKGPLLVYFWGSWCGICSLTSPAVHDIAEDSNVLTIALASGSDAEVQQYMDQHGYQFTTLNDDNGLISQQWGVTITPSLFYLNTEGEITQVSAGLSSEWGMRLKLWLARFI